MKKGYNTPNSYYISSMKEQGKEPNQIEAANKIGCFSLIVLAVLLVGMIIWSNL